MLEQILQDYDHAYGLKSVALRYFNAAGADPEGELGECHEPETHLIPLVLQAASGRRLPDENNSLLSPTPFLPIRLHKLRFQLNASNPFL